MRVVSASFRFSRCSSRSAALPFGVELDVDEVDLEECAMPILAVSSASDSCRSTSKTRRPGMASMSRRGSISSVEDWTREWVCNWGSIRKRGILGRLTELTRPGTCTSTRRRPSSSLIHDQSSGVSSIGIAPFSIAIAVEDPEVEGPGFFKMPLRPGRGAASPALAPLSVDVGDDAAPFVVEDTSWIRGLEGSCAGCWLADGAPVRAGSIAAGTCTVRGRSLPLLAILGVPIFRDSTRPVWASMRCSASSVA